MCVFRVAKPRSLSSAPHSRSPQSTHIRLDALCVQVDQKQAAGYATMSRSFQPLDLASNKYNDKLDCHIERLMVWKMEDSFRCQIPEMFEQHGQLEQTHALQVEAVEMKPCKRKTSDRLHFQS